MSVAIIPVAVLGAENSPTTIYTNATIVTLDPTNRIADSIAVRDGEILALGSLADVKKSAGDGATVLDLQGRTLLPGFYAAHDHFLNASVAALYHLDLNSPPIGQIESIEEIVTALRERAAATPPGAWIGLRFSVHSDTPVTPVDPLLLVWAAVNRITREGKVLGADERISVVDALRAVTSDAAWQSFEEQRKGSLEPGKLADFAILAENPLTVPPQRLKDIPIEETIVGGRSVWRRSGP